MEKKVNNEGTYIPLTEVQRNTLRYFVEEQNISSATITVEAWLTNARQEIIREVIEEFRNCNSSNEVGRAIRWVEDKYLKSEKDNK